MVTKKFLLVAGPGETEGTEAGPPVEVTVRSDGSFLNLTVAGYGMPVSLSYYGGTLKVDVWDDGSEDEPTHSIDLEGAREKAGRK